MSSGGSFTHSPYGTAPAIHIPSSNDEDDGPRLVSPKLLLHQQSGGGRGSGVSTSHTPNTSFSSLPSSPKGQAQQIGVRNDSFASRQQQHTTPGSNNSSSSRVSGTAVPVKSPLQGYVNSPYAPAQHGSGAARASHHQHYPQSPPPPETMYVDGFPVGGSGGGGGGGPEIVHPAQKPQRGPAGGSGGGGVPPSYAPQHGGRGTPTSPLQHHTHHSSAFSRSSPTFAAGAAEGPNSRESSSGALYRGAPVHQGDYQPPAYFHQHHQQSQVGHHVSHHHHHQHHQHSSQVPQQQYSPLSPPDSASWGLPPSHHQHQHPSQQQQGVGGRKGSGSKGALLGRSASGSGSASGAPLSPTGAPARPPKQGSGSFRSTQPPHLQQPHLGSPTSLGPQGVSPSSAGGGNRDSNRASAKEHRCGGGGWGGGSLPPASLLDGADTMSQVSWSSSNASSVPNDLPLCEEDGDCPLINDRKHQKVFAHTCRLFPCYHAHVKRHAKLFRHTAEQIPAASASPSNLDGGVAGSDDVVTCRQRRRNRNALTSVNFNLISPEAPNAAKITVACRDVAYDIFGDWASVKVHTFKRYLHQVFGIPPTSQLLYLNFTQLLDDELETAANVGVMEGCTVQVKVDDDSSVMMPSMDTTAVDISVKESVRGGVLLQPRSQQQVLRQQANKTANKTAASGNETEDAPAATKPKGSVIVGIDDL